MRGFSGGNHCPCPSEAEPMVRPKFKGYLKRIYSCLLNRRITLFHLWWGICILLLQGVNRFFPGAAWAPVLTVELIPTHNVLCECSRVMWDKMSICWVKGGRRKRWAKRWGWKYVDWKNYGVKSGTKVSNTKLEKCQKRGNFSFSFSATCLTA